MRLTLRETLNILEAVEVNLSDMIRRRCDGISAEIRAEIMTEAYEPVLKILIRGRRRPETRT